MRTRAQDRPSRPRRNRRSSTVRAAVQENSLSPSNFILPLFVHEGDKNEGIPSMPGVERLSYANGLTDFVSEARSYGVNQVVIFPKVRCRPRHGAHALRTFSACAAVHGCARCGVPLQHRCCKRGRARRVRECCARRVRVLRAAADAG